MMRFELDAFGTGSPEVASARELADRREVSVQSVLCGPQTCVTVKLVMDIMIHVGRSVWAVVVDSPTTILDAAS